MLNNLSDVKQKVKGDPIIMKKISTLLALVMVMALAVPVLAADEEGAKAEITGGKVEFESTIFSSDVDKAEKQDDDDNDVDVTTGDKLTVNEGTSELTVELTGVYKAFDWTLTAGHEDFGLAFLQSTENGEVEFSSTVGDNGDTFWADVVQDAELRAKKTVGKVEAQAKVNPNAGVVKDTDTYVKYSFTDALDMTFKPYDVEFLIGSEWETEVGASDKLPGMQTTYEVGDLTLTADVSTEGTYSENVNDANGSEASARGYALESTATYDLNDDDSVTTAVLLKADTTTDKANEDAEELTDKDSDLTVNVNGGYTVTEALSLDGEFNYGSYSETEEGIVDGDVEKTTDEVEKKLGLYAKTTYDLSVASVYGSYKYDNTATEYNLAEAASEIEKETTTINTITVGADKELEDGVTLNVEFETAPTKTETEYVEDDTETDESVTNKLTTKVTYSF